MSETAYAKINLALHVRGRRQDGYHEIETLFAFVDDGDLLAMAPAEQDRIFISGEFGDALTDPFDNIVAHALGAFPRGGEGWAIAIEKRLPVAAGLGGGSANAGALIRMVQDAHGLPDDWLERASRLGADVPACVESRACIGRGIGTRLEPVDNDLAGMPVLLVNPRVPMPTGPVFMAWDGQDRGAMPRGGVNEIARRGRNDLERAALSLRPDLAPVRDALAATGATLVRMSGSGATFFALYDNEALRDEAHGRIAAAQPGWWQMSGALR